MLSFPLIICCTLFNIPYALEVSLDIFKAEPYSSNSRGSFFLRPHGSGNFTYGGN